MNTPLNPDGLRAAEELMIRTDRITKINYLDADRIITAYLAVAQPVVTSVEELVTTPAGRALANAAFNEGLSAGIKACNEAEADRPWVKPVSPYRPEVKP